MTKVHTIKNTKTGEVAAYVIRPDGDVTVKLTVGGKTYSQPSNLEAARKSYANAIKNGWVALS